MYEERIMNESSEAISWVKFDKEQSDSSQMKNIQLKSIN